MWLTALVNALPAIAGIAKDVINHDDKAATAAQVATDPNAPPAVKQAATNMASQAIADKAKAEQAALQAATGQKPAPTSEGSSTATVALVVLAALLLGKRR